MVVLLTRVCSGPDACAENQLCIDFVCVNVTFLPPNATCTAGYAASPAPAPSPSASFNLLGVAMRRRCARRRTCAREASASSLRSAVAICAMQVRSRLPLSCPRRPAHLCPEAYPSCPAPLTCSESTNTCVPDSMFGTPSSALLSALSHARRRFVDERDVLLVHHQLLRRGAPHRRRLHLR